MENNINLSYCPEEKYCYIYGPDDVIISYTNNIVKLNYIRKEIARNKLYGYYVKFDDNKYNIDEDGLINNTPPDFFNLHDRLELETFSYTVNKNDINEDLINYCFGRDVEYEDV